MGKPVTKPPPTRRRGPTLGPLLGLILGSSLALAAPGCAFDPQGLASAGDASAPVDGTLPDGAAPDAAPGDPTPPLGVSIPAVPGVCPAQAVNSATVTAAAVVVTLGPASRADQQVRLRVEGGPAVAQPAPRAAPAGAGTVSFALDLSTFPDGPLVLVAQVEAPGGVRTVEVRRDARKDTVLDLQVDPVVTPVDDSQQALSGLTEPGAALVLGNATLGATAVALADGDGYFEAFIPLGPGANQLWVRATDAAGNEGDAWVDREARALVVVVQAGADVPLFTQEAATRLTTTTAVGPCTDSAAASFVFVRAPDLANGDVAPDLFVSCVNQLFLNDGQGQFTHLVSGIQGDRGAVWGDFDNDGDQDVAVVRQASTDLRLYENQLIPAGTVSFTLTGGLLPYDPGNPEGVAWLDVDHDGHLDLLLSDGARNEVLLGSAGGGFTAAGDLLGINTLGTPLDNGSWLAVADYDGDGWVDVALSDDVGPGFVLSGAGGFFVDVTATTGAAFVNPAKRGLSFGDFDGDGRFDLFVAQGHALGGANALLQYDPVGGQFTDVAAAAGVDLPLAHDGAAWGDVDLDGHLDLVYYTLPAPDRIEIVLQLNRGDTDSDGVPDFETHTFEHMLANPAGFSPDTALLADVDGDGDLDLLVASRNGGHLLFMNQRTSPSGVSRSPRHLRVLLHGNGVGCNRSAVGSTVWLRDCDSQVVLAAREVNGGRGNGGQESPVLHFGGLMPSRCVQVEARFAGGAAVTRRVRPVELPAQTLLIFQP